MRAKRLTVQQRKDIFHALVTTQDLGLMTVTDLKKDDQGIWRGKAMHDGKSVTVGFDYKGNIGAQ